MIRDYSRRRPAGIMRQQVRRPRQGRPAMLARVTEYPRELVLGVLALGLLLTILLSAWLATGARAEIERQGRQLAALAQGNQELLERREQLSSYPRIVEEAAKLGLYPPREGQVRKINR